MTSILLLLVWALVTGGVWVFFSRHGGKLHDASEPTAQHLGSWLTGSPTRDMAWASVFVAWFDRIFRVRFVKIRWGEVALPSFTRSVLASLLSLLVLAMVWGLNKESISFGSPGRGLDQVGGTQVAVLVGVYGTLTLVTNWVPDYLSLVESRFILGKLRQSRGGVRVGAWLLLDAVLTLAIAFFVIWGAGRLALPLLDGRVPPLYVGCLTSETFDLNVAWTMFESGLRLQTPPATLNYDAAGIYVYSTFLTSLWVWLFLTAGKLVQAFSLLVPNGRHWVANRPAVALGLGAALLTGGSLFAVTNALFDEHADVWIAHGPKGVADANRLQELFEEEGLHVVATPFANPDPTLRQASVVVVIAERVPEENQLQTELRLAVRCGERGRATVHRVRPGDPVARTQRQVHGTSLLLGSEQIAKCRQQRQLPPMPAECSDGW